MPKEPDKSLGDIPHIRNEKRPDFSTNPPPKRSVPKSIQNTLDNDEKLWELLYEGRAQESTDSNVRYAGYAARVRTIMSSAHRYAAYTSEVGESFRPIAHPILVRSAYAVSWAYIIGDVAHEGYKAYLRQAHLSEASAKASNSNSNSSSSSTPPSSLVLQQQQYRQSPLEDYRVVMTQRALFQSIASMALPAFTVHSIVRYSGRALKNVKNARIRAWGPIGLGLAAVPFLPYLFDDPIEQVVEKTFHKGFEMYYGPERLRGLPSIGRHEKLQAESQSRAMKEKDL